MRTFGTAVTALVVFDLLAASMVQGRSPDTLIAAEEQPSKIVAVRDVTTRDGVVHGVLVNRSNKTLRDVRLLIRHTWLWKNEKKPGEDSPGRVDYYTVRSELPPGGTVELTYRPQPPLPDRDDGRFETSVEVVGWTEIGR